MMLNTKYQGSRPRLEGFPIKAYVKHVTTGWGHFWPQDHNLNNLGKGPLDDVKYQISRP